LPNTKTAEKEMRASVRRRARNKATHSQTKTNIRKAEETIASGNLDKAKADITIAISALDKEAEKGKLHRNNAARCKSRLVKKLNKAAAATQTEKK